MSSRPKAPKELRQALAHLKKLAEAVSWDSKRTFPSHLEKPLFDYAKMALSTESTPDGYLVDRFFQRLMTILPYNMFTLKKLVYRNIFPLVMRREGCISIQELQLDQYFTRP
ncbi:hypothetical protein BGX23_007407 [Mortierella sp. AD031]|nr:hypothetical protein BGX23_007407 [Mortierella sp. AD031]